MQSLGDENVIGLEPHVINNHTQRIAVLDGDLEINLNSELRVIENFFEGVPSSGDENVVEVNNSQLGGDENAMEVNNSRLGLETEVNIEDGNGVMQYEEDIVSSAVNNVHESSQDSLGLKASATNSENTTNPLMHRTSDLLMVGSVSTYTNETKIQDLASATMEELREMATRGEPLWHRRGGDDSQLETLNSLEYMWLFGSVDAKLEKLMRMVKAGDPNCMPSLDSSVHERLPVPRGDHYRIPTTPLEHEEQQPLKASRHIGYVDIMTAVSIVELFMNVNQWLATFENIVSSATLLGALSTGVNGSYDGAVQVDLFIRLMMWIRHNRKSEKKIIESKPKEISTKMRGLPPSLSDHNPIMIGDLGVKWGPSPFRFLNWWLEEKDMMKKVMKGWRNCQVLGSKGFVLFSKAKATKLHMKKWIMSSMMTKIDSKAAQEGWTEKLKKDKIVEELWKSFCREEQIWR
ncbi:hypothetical protein Ddye_027352 [Dipteronia dyeriana]|uniref:START domain-containing protein n=1 Tax=Dipteronia dyeriana TaxID=168575 RepID=A0AAD9WRB5_9ROSI|nr:hypothetical protein Ddye_027352 [Dipteronia dyeriana]